MFLRSAVRFWIMPESRFEDFGFRCARGPIAPTPPVAAESRPAPTLPEVQPETLSAGGSHTCSIKRDGVVVCWEDNREGQATPPAGAFIQVSAGDWHTCGVKNDGTVACWAKNDDGQTTPPAGMFTQVSAGD